TYGIAGKDYNMVNGDPQITTDGKNRSQYVPWQYVMDHPYVQYQADLPGYAKRSFEVEQLLVSQSVLDPTLGSYSPTQLSAKGGTADREFEEAAREIVLGRRQLSELDGLVKKWQSDAGDQIRKEYQDALTANR